MSEPATASTGSDRYADAMRRFSGDLRMTQQVFASMEQRDVPIEPVHWQLLLAAHLDARDVAGARQVMERMQAAGVEIAAGTRWDLAIATGRAGRTEQALVLLDELHNEGADPDERHAPAVLSIYLAVGRFPAARAVLRQMSHRGQAAADADYGRLLRDCLDRRAIKDTRTIVELMLQVGRRPTSALGSELVAMIARAGHTTRAIELLERLRAAGVTLSSEAYTELLLAHAKAGDATAAEASLDAMRQAGTEPSSFHRNAVLQARIAAGDAEAAWDVALGLAADGRIPSGENLEGLLDVSLSVGNLPAASGVIDWLLILGVPVPPQKAADVLGRHLKAGELDVALGLFDEMTAHGVPADRRVARDLVDRLVRASRLDEARVLLERLRGAGTLTHGRHYGSLLAAFAASKRVDDAVALLRHMLEHKIAPTSSDASRLVGGLVKSGDLALAGDLIAELQDGGVSVDEPTYRELMWSHARKGEHEPAKTVFARMVAAGITPDDRHQKALEWASGETKRRLPDQPASASDEPATQEIEPTPPTPPAAPEPASAMPPATAQPHADVTVPPTGAVTPTGPPSPPVEPFTQPPAEQPTEAEGGGEDGAPAPGA